MASYKHVKMETPRTNVITPVVVGIDHKYNDNDGATSVAVLWDGAQITHDVYACAYNGGSWDDRKVNATAEQIAAAGRAYRLTSGDTARGTYVTCTVILARSRKAPNGVPLQVVDHRPKTYAYEYLQPEQVCVMSDGRKIWVSVGCIKQIVQYAAPFWNREVQS